jgi:hypothetical protein
VGLVVVEMHRPQQQLLVAQAQLIQAVEAVQDLLLQVKTVMVVLVVQV